MTNTPEAINLHTKRAPYVVFMVNKASGHYIQEDYWTLWEAQRAQEEGLRGGLAVTLVDIRKVAQGDQAPSVPVNRPLGQLT